MHVGFHSNVYYLTSKIYRLTILAWTSLKLSSFETFLSKYLYMQFIVCNWCDLMFLISVQIKSLLLKNHPIINHFFLSLTDLNKHISSNTSPMHALSFPRFGPEFSAFPLSHLLNIPLTLSLCREEEEDDEDLTVPPHGTQTTAQTSHPAWEGGRQDNAS